VEIIGSRTTDTACSPGDQNEVAGNRAWRDLVEQKFPAAAERIEIKPILRIPL